MWVGWLRPISRARPAGASPSSPVPIRVVTLSLATRASVAWVPLSRLGEDAGGGDADSVVVPVEDVEPSIGAVGQVLRQVEEGLQ